MIHLISVLGGAGLIQVAISAALSFAATNLDDILLLMLLFSAAKSAAHRRRIALGQFLGIGILTAAALLGGVGLSLLPDAVLRLLGLVPMYLGVRMLLQRRDADAPAAIPAGAGSALSVALLTVANGGDNLGVYLPLFAGYTLAQSLLTVVIFGALTGLWCLLAQGLISLPGLGETLRRRGSVLVPWVLILLGLYILLG